MKVQRSLSSYHWYYTTNAIDIIPIIVRDSVGGCIQPVRLRPDSRRLLPPDCWDLRGEGRGGPVVGEGVDASAVMPSLPSDGR